jgi:hypothetical protein|tara:strand:- start:58 stop:363 length:306 start_codon:yes stop_codon:yes gene_type:complete
MNLPIQGPVDPKDDTFYKEQISKIGAILLNQKECTHDYQEVGGDLAQCRLCGKRTRWENMPASNDTVMMRAYGVTFMVPMKCLPVEFQRTIQIRRRMAGEK